MSYDLYRDHVGPGWQPIIDQLHQDLLALDPDYTVEQIKEKFGGLRYYIGFNEDLHEQQDALISEAMKKAEQTCEVCGEPGTNKPVNGWWLTLCDSHREAAQRERTTAWQQDGRS